MNELTIRVRTKDDLIQLLKEGGSCCWKIAKLRETKLKKIEVYNWDGSLVIKAEYNSHTSRRTDNNRLYLGFSNAKIKAVNPPLKWHGQNPVNYVEENPNDSKNLTIKVDHRLIDQNLEELIEQVVKKKTQETIVNYPPQRKQENKKEPTRRELLEELLQSNYGEEVKLLDYEINKDIVKGCFLEKRREWYFSFELNLKKESLGYQPHNFISNMSDEALYEIYPRLNEKEKTLILNLIRLSNRYGGDVLLLSEDEFPEDINQYGFIPDSDCFPVIIYDNYQTKILGGFYLFNNSNKSLSEQIISNENDNSVKVFDDLQKAFYSLVQNIEYQYKS